MEHAYRLKFFDFMGIAEPIRYLLAYGGIKYDNVVIQKGPNWDLLKKNIPFGKLPVLEIDDILLYQSVAISQFLAKMVQLIPDDDLEIAELEAIALSIFDFGARVHEWYHVDDLEYKKKLLSEIEDEVIPLYLNDLELIAQKQGGYLGGKQVSWVDMYLVGVLESVQGMLNRVLLQKQYPLLYQIFLNVQNIPAIKNYIAQRPSYKY